jgi:hypothetical protein
MHAQLATAPQIIAGYLRKPYRRDEAKAQQIDYSNSFVFHSSSILLIILQDSTNYLAC